MSARDMFVLFSGTTFRQYGEGRRLLRDYLLDMDPNTNLNSAWRGFIDGALDGTEDWEHLDIIIIVDGTITSREHLIEQSKELAEKIHQDGRKPWISLCENLNYLQPIFEARGVRVEQGFIGDVVTRRWAERTENKAA